MPTLTLSSPFGLLTLSEDNGAITSLRWGGAATGETPLLAEAARQLAAYFSGELQGFTLPFRFLPGLNGAVQRAMLAIPFGETRTYGDLARELGVPAQTIGQACGANTIPIIIPCHRVLSADGLGGYSAPGGVETKVALLRHEGAAGLLL